MLWAVENEPNLQLQNPLRAGDVALVARSEGLGDFTSVLYIRQHLVDHVQPVLDTFMADRQKRLLYVTGPPGCGKTCFLYLWARLYAVENRMRVLIVQFRENHGILVWVRERNGVLSRAKDDTSIEPTEWKQMVVDILKHNQREGTPFDLCIHVGVIHKLTEGSSMVATLNTAARNNIIKKVIHVTSLAFRLTGGGQLTAGPMSDLVKLAVDSWREQDYQNAVSSQDFMSQMRNSPTNPLFKDAKFLLAQEEEENESALGADTDPNNETLLKVVTAKYFYAGGSARFMFQHNLETLRSDLDDYMKIINTSDWGSFTEEGVASGTPSAVNTLMQQFNKTCTPVSDYVLWRAYEKCQTKLVKSVRAAANSTQNPALAGWAFELEQIEVLRLSYESTAALPVFATNHNGLSFRPTSQAEFNETDVTSGNVQDGTVIWCQKWNQGCFDVALYSNRTLITIQFTLQAVHSLKPQFVRKLRDALLKENFSVDRCVHIGMREDLWDELQFNWETLGTGRQAGDEVAEFQIEVYRSPPMKNEPKLTAEFNLPRDNFLFRGNMWKLPPKRPREDEEEEQE